MKPTELKDHVLATYLTLRIGIAVLAVALPLLLWVGGHFRADLPLQGSMSAYYHAGGGAMRDVFVGVLVAVGAFLVLYRGYTSLENRALNLAGLLVVGVAMVPMEWGCGESCREVSVHGTLAVLFFVCIAYVCLFRASDTLTLMDDRAKARRYKRAYKLMGIALIISPAVAMLLTLVVQPRAEARSTVFFVETLGVLVFAIYWVVKSREIALSGSDRAAVEGELRTPSLGPAEAFKEAPVQRVR